MDWIIIQCHVVSKSKGIEARSAGDPGFSSTFCSSSVTGTHASLVAISSIKIQIIEYRFQKIWQRTDLSRNYNIIDLRLWFWMSKKITGNSCFRVACPIIKLLFFDRVIDKPFQPNSIKQIKNRLCRRLLGILGILHTKYDHKTWNIHKHKH